MYLELRKKSATMYNSLAKVGKENSKSMMKHKTINKFWLLMQL